MNSPKPWRSCLLVALLAAGCSGSNPAGPGSVNPNMPAATGIGGTNGNQGSPVTPTQVIQGAVLNARTGTPLPKAKIYIQQLSSTESDMASGSVANPPASDSMPASGSAPTTAPQTGPAPTSSPIVPITQGVDDKGRFKIKDLPLGDYAVTVYAPDYQAITLAGSKPSNLQVPLVPQVPPQGHDLGGQVTLANGSPAPAATVDTDYMPGFTVGDQETTDAAGNFELKGLPGGRHDLVAFTTNSHGEITTFAMASDVPVSEGKDKHTGHPILVLHAVTRPLILSGTVSPSPDKIAPRQIQVVMTTDHGQIPMLVSPVGKSGDFRFSLPGLPEGASYHLIASGVDRAGDVAIAHLQDINDSNLKVALTLPTLPPTMTVATDSTLVFTWNAISEVSAYRVRLESTGDQAQTLWEGWTSMTQLEVPSILHLLHRGQTYRYSITALKVSQGADTSLASLAGVPWSWAATRAPQEIVWDPASENTSPHPSSKPLPPPARPRAPADSPQRPPSPTSSSTGKKGPWS